MLLSESFPAFRRDKTPGDPPHFLIVDADERVLDRAAGSGGRTRGRVLRERVPLRPADADRRPRHRDERVLQLLQRRCVHVIGQCRHENSLESDAGRHCTQRAGH